MAVLERMVIVFIEFIIFFLLVRLPGWIEIKAHRRHSAMISVLSHRNVYLLRWKVHWHCVPDSRKLVPGLLTTPEADGYCHGYCASLVDIRSLHNVLFVWRGLCSVQTHTRRWPSGRNRNLSKMTPTRLHCRELFRLGHSCARCDEIVPLKELALADRNDRSRGTITVTVTVMCVSATYVGQCVQPVDFKQPICTICSSPSNHDKHLQQLNSRDSVWTSCFCVYVCHDVIRMMYVASYGWLIDRTGLWPYWFSSVSSERLSIFMALYIWAPPRPLLAVPNVIAHPSTASVPITYLGNFCYILYFLFYWAEPRGL